MIWPFEFFLIIVLNIITKIKTIPFRFRQLEIRDVQIRTSNLTRTVLSAYGQALGMFGNEEWVNTFLNKIKVSKTKEVSSVYQLGPYISHCMTQYSPYINVLPRENDTTFRMKDQNCTLLQNLLDPKILVKGEDAKEYEKFDKQMKQWSDVHYK